MDTPAPHPASRLAWPLTSAFIRTISNMNPLGRAADPWRALEAGHREATVAKYMARRQRPRIRPRRWTAQQLREAFPAETAPFHGWPNKSPFSESRLRWKAEPGACREVLAKHRRCQERHGPSLAHPQE
jgi:hypothetical protein